MTQKDNATVVPLSFPLTVPDLAALYDEHAGAIHAFALHLLHDEPEARDILQSVFARLARSGQSNRSDGSDKSDRSAQSDRSSPSYSPTLRPAHSPAHSPPPASAPAAIPTRSGLLKLTHWLILDRLRQQKSASTRETRWTTESQPLFTPSADPDTVLFDEALAAALLILPVEQRAVVHLHLWENSTFDAIGEMLGLSKNTAASRYRLALAKLQDHLRPLYNEIR